MAFTAFWKGILYDAATLAKAEHWLAPLQYEELQAIRPALAQHALRTRLRGRELAEWASEALALAQEGLQRIGHRNAQGQDESMYLQPLAALVAQGLSPADVLLQELGETPSLNALLTKLAL